jgi:hypothetical protein
VFFPFQKIGVKDMSISSRVNFFSKGKDAGFSVGEIRILYHLAKMTGIDHPGMLFWSRVQLDTCIKTLIKDLRAKGITETPENQTFLNKLFELRKKLEIECPRNNQGITDSYNIEESQSLQVVISGAGIFKSRVIQNTNNYLLIRRPNSSILPVNFDWAGKTVIVYFSRKNDANYCFESSILEEHISENGGTLSVKHNKNFQRTRYRNSMRAKTHRPAYLYPAESETETTEVISRIKCFLENISDSGCAVSVSGKAPVGFKVVIQFTLDNTPVSISGVVRACKYDGRVNRSILRIQSNIMPLSTKNLIMCVVLGAIEDEPDIVPFSASNIEQRLDKGLTEIQNKDNIKKPEDLAGEEQIHDADNAAEFEWDKL